MTSTLLIFSSLVALFGLFQRAGYLKAPTLMAIVFAAWFAPQLFVLTKDPLIPCSSITDVAILATFCIIAVLIGWKLGSKSPYQEQTRNVAFNVEALVVPVSLLTVFTTAINLYLNHLRGTAAGQESQWSGPITIVAFFASLRIVPLAFSLLMVLKKRTPVTIVLAVINLAVTIPIAIIFLRRSEMIDIGLAGLGALWFSKRFRVPLPAIVVSAVAFSLVVYAIGPLRGAQKSYETLHGQSISLLNPKLWKDIDLSVTVQSSIDKSPDVRNAVYSTQYVNEISGPAYGATLWNAFVFRYIPAQILGREFKEGLVIDGGNLQTQELAREYNYEFKVGTTSTGVGSSYRDFGYFGFVYFFIVGYGMSRIYKMGISGNPWAQAAYLCLLPQCLIMITHSHSSFFIILPMFAATFVGLRMIKSGKIAKSAQAKTRHSSNRFRQNVSLKRRH